MNREPLPASRMFLPGDVLRILNALLYLAAAIEDGKVKRGYIAALGGMAVAFGLEGEDGNYCWDSLGSGNELFHLHVSDSDRDGAPVARRR